MNKKQDDFENLNKDINHAFIFVGISTFLGVILIGLMLSMAFKNEDVEEYDPFKPPIPKPHKIKDTYKNFNDKNTIIILRNDGSRYMINNNNILKFKRIK